MVSEKKTQKIKRQQIFAKNIIYKQMLSSTIEASLIKKTNM